MTGLRISAMLFDDETKAKRDEINALFVKIEKLVESDIYDTRARKTFFDFFETTYLWLGKACKGHQLIKNDRFDHPEKYVVLEERKAYAKRCIDKAIDDVKNPKAKPVTREFKQSAMGTTIVRKGNDEINIKGRRIAVERKRV